MEYLRGKAKTALGYVRSSTPAPQRESISESVTESTRLVKGYTQNYVDWTHSEEVLFLARLSFIIYIVVAIIGYSFVLEDWPITDSLYFAMTIFSTVGYGDLSPTSDLSRVFTIVYASGGIFILGVFFGQIAQRVFERNEEKVKARLLNGRKKVKEQFSKKDTSKDFSSESSLMGDLFFIFRVQASMLVIIALVAVPIVYIEGWDIVQGIYWMFVTGTTIGFGDLAPSTTITKVLCIIYLPFCVAIFGELLAKISGIYVVRKADKVEEEFLNRAMTLADFERMDLDKDGFVSEAEFLQFMLITMQKVDKEEIDDILEAFSRLDNLTKDGKICKDDLKKQYNLKVNADYTHRVSVPGYV